MSPAPTAYRQSWHGRIANTIVLRKRRSERPTRAHQKVIGLIGGMSCDSTAEYYRLANELVRDRHLVSDQIGRLLVNAG